MFGYENVLIFSIYVSDLKFDDDKPHYVYIKDFNRFMFHKTKIKIIIGFARVVSNILVVEMC